MAPSRSPAPKASYADRVSDLFSEADTASSSTSGPVHEARARRMPSRDSPTPAAFLPIGVSTRTAFGAHGSPGSPAERNDQTSAPPLMNVGKSLHPPRPSGRFLSLVAGSRHVGPRPQGGSMWCRAVVPPTMPQVPARTGRAGAQHPVRGHGRGALGQLGPERAGRPRRRVPRVVPRDPRQDRGGEHEGHGVEASAG